MALIFVAQLVALIGYAIPVRGAGNNSQCHHTTALTNIRLPPAIDPTVDVSPPTWDPMPPGWWYGDWHVAHTSNKKYQALHDLVWSLTPVLPTCGLATDGTPASCPLGSFPGQLNDLSTWFVNSSVDTYTSAFGYDTPRRVNNGSAGPGWVDVWDTVGAGQLSYFQNGWQILAWGYDGDGMGYMLNYETAVISDETPACLDILSRVAGGPDNATVEAVGVAIEGLDSEEISSLGAQMRRTAFDRRRETLPAFVCGPDCVNNTDIASGNI